MIALPTLKLAYQYVPKVGTTSLFTYLYACLYGHKYQPQRHAHHGTPVFVHKYFLAGLCPDAHEIGNTMQEAQELGTYYRFAITRDPIRRFLSMYSNRVLQKRELAADSHYAVAIRQAGLPFDPGINYLVSHLDSYLSCHSSLLHHARPMTDFLGTDLSVYGRISDLASINHVIDDIKRHWRSMDMATLAESAPPLARMQGGGARIGLDILNTESFDKLADYYRADYANLPTVSLPEMEGVYWAARKTASAMFHPASGGHHEAARNPVGRR